MSRLFISTLASERLHNRKQKQNDQIGKNRIGHPAKDDLSGIYQFRSAMLPQTKKDTHKEKRSTSRAVKPISSVATFPIDALKRRTTHETRSSVETPRARASIRT
jgi:hypothetical protein